MTKPPSALLRLWPRVRPYRSGLYIAGVTLLLASAITLGFPMAAKYLLDSAFLKHDRTLLNRIAIGMLAGFALQGLLQGSCHTTPFHCIV